MYSPSDTGADCLRCPLRRRKPVPPNGPEDADFVIVGENPGVNEEREGRGFVGASGGKLNELLAAAGISRDRCWITNAIKCRCETPGVRGRLRYDTKTFLSFIKTENAKAVKALKAAKMFDRTKFETEQKIRSPFECCRPALWTELRWFEGRALERGHPNGIVVIPMGNFAVWAVAQARASISRMRGSPLEIDVGAMKMRSTLPWERT